MKQISYIVLAIFITITALGQVDNKDINLRLIELGLDNRKQNDTQFSKQLLNTWIKLGHEENKYMPFIVLPMNVWEELFEKQYNKTKDTNLKAQMGVTYSTILIDLSKYEKALNILKLAYVSKNKLTKEYYKVLLNNLETCYKSKNEISKAIEIRNELIENKLINNYWRIYKACGLAEAAIEDFKLFEEKKYYVGNEKVIKPDYYNNLSRLYFSDNKIDSAVKYAEIGLHYIEEALQDKSIHFAYKMEILSNWKSLYIGFLGKCDLTKKDYLKAIPKLKYAVDNGKIDVESNTLSMVYLSLCYLNLNELNNYKLYSDSVKNKIKSIDAEDVIRSYYSASQQYYSKINKYDSAFRYLTLYSKFRDKMSKGVQQNQSILLLGQLEIQKRRNELNENISNLKKIEKENENVKGQIGILGIFIAIFIIILILLTHYLILGIKNKKIIDQKNNELNENMDLTKDQIIKNEFLLKELHHRVKNNLQLIYSLLNLQKRRLNDDDTKSNLTAVQNRIHTMSLVHEFLYISDNNEYINVNEYVKTLTKHLKSIYKKEGEVNIDYNIDEEIELETERMIYLGLIINEIISNTFKFEIGNMHNTLIKICIESINGIIEICISDNGPGFNKAQIREESLGLKLITIMCEQLHANHELDSTNGVVHTIKFSFEKNNIIK